MSCVSLVVVQPQVLLMHMFGSTSLFWRGGGPHTPFLLWQIHPWFIPDITVAQEVSAAGRVGRKSGPMNLAP